MIAWLIANFGGYIAAAGGAIALVAGVWLKGRQSAKADLQQEQDRHRAEAITAKRKSDSEIDDLGAADVDQRMSHWLRR